MKFFLNIMSGLLLIAQAIYSQPTPDKNARIILPDANMLIERLTCAGFGQLIKHTDIIADLASRSRPIDRIQNVIAYGVLKFMTTRSLKWNAAYINNVEVKMLHAVLNDVERIVLPPKPRKPPIISSAS